jgi:hypothetical protein
MPDIPLLLVDGMHSIWDAERTEAVLVASIIDGAHVTFAENLSFSHAAGLYIDWRVAQENIVEGNVHPVGRRGGDLRQRRALLRRRREPLPLQRQQRHHRPDPVAAHHPEHRQQ